MNTFSLARDEARFTAISAAILVATVAALLAVFALAKPSGAQAAPTELTVAPTEVNFNTAPVDDRYVGSVVTRRITVTNNSSTPITIGGARLELATGELLLDSAYAVDLGPDGQLLVAGNGGTGTFEVTFNPDDVGVQDAVLKLEQLVDGSIGGTIALVDQAGNTVQGIDLTGTGTNPAAAPAANCTIVGTNNGETIPGTPGNDVICAMGGNDTVRSSGGNDVVRGGSGNDRLTDKLGRDKLFGEAGKDRLSTRDGKRRDVVNGGPRRDIIKKDKGDRGKRR